MPISSDEIAALHKLSRGLEWLHTSDEWALMLQTSKLFTMHDEFNYFASALLTTYSKFATIGMVLTDKEHGRLGLGGALTAMALSKARKMGIENISLISSHKAEGLYRKLGFSEVGVVSMLARTGASSLVQSKLRQRYGLPSAQTISQKYYEGCPLRTKILEIYIAQSNGFFDFVDDGGQLTGFVGSIVRENSKGEKSLAFGPFLADTPEIAKELISKVVATNVPMTCFVVDNLVGPPTNGQEARRKVFDDFLNNGFTLVDRLPLMTFNGVPASQYTNPAVLSPVSLALG